METTKLIDYLKQFISPERVEKIECVIGQRTRHITILLENIFQSQNASAVLRSAECLGIQDVHVVENDNLFEVHADIALGSSKWLTIHRYNEAESNTITAIQNLKRKGYRVLATMPNQNDCMIDEIDLSVPTAFMFGTELTGLSQEAIALADGFVKIPMYGFTESFNISVSAALLMNNVAGRLRDSNISWQLSPIHKEEVMLDWLKKSLKKPELIIERFWNNNQG